MSGPDHMPGHGGPCEVIAANLEKRREERIDTLRSADLLFDGGRPPIACTVRDVSELGLRLLVETPLHFPDRVEVILNHPKQQRRCQVIWRTECEAGLRFID